MTRIGKQPINQTLNQMIKSMQGEEEPYILNAELLLVWVPQKGCTVLYFHKRVFCFNYQKVLLSPCCGGCACVGCDSRNWAGDWSGWPGIKTSCWSCNSCWMSCINKSTGFEIEHR